MKVNKNGSPLFRVDIITKTGSVAKIILLPFWAITIAFCIIIDLFMAYKYPICDVFHWFCKIVRFFATEPEKALPLSQRALEIDEKVLGPQHPSVATSLNNLAVLYKEMGDYEKALPLSQRTLEICEKILGPKHPNTMIIRNNFMQSANNREDKKEN